MVFSRFGSGRQSSQLQASKASFLAGSESEVRQWHRGFGSAVGTGMPWGLPVSEAAAKAVSCRLQRLVFKRAQKATLGTGTRASEAPLGPACHGIFPFRKRPPKQSAAGSESDVRQWHRGFGSAIGTGMPWCLPLSEAAAKAVSCRLQRLVF